MWTLLAYRRVKNVIVTLEWIPNVNALKIIPVSETKQKLLSKTQETLIRKAFDLFDIRQSQTLTKVEFKQFLRVLDVDVDGSSGEQELNENFATLDRDVRALLPPASGFRF